MSRSSDIFFINDIEKRLQQTIDSATWAVSRAIRIWNEKMVFSSVKPISISNSASINLSKEYEMEKLRRKYGGGTKGMKPKFQYLQMFAS